MKQLLIQVDDLLAAALERHVPARSRRRSEFVRRAIQRALDAELELQMAAAYRAVPDDEVAYFNPAVWEPAAWDAVPARRKPARKPARKR